ncbi:hypothetical protein GQ53DRAFT_753853 [Thozetella sp. PMI_491]|nr:hypothetical protein GQ53DRAFT_753853 [Thozetella sp. PMI_491]
MNTLEYDGRPALHIVEPTVMDCPSGPFRSQFLMSNPLFAVYVASRVEMEKRCPHPWLRQ